MNTNYTIELLTLLNNCNNNDKILIKTFEIILKRLYETRNIYFIKSVIHLYDTDFWTNNSIKLFADIINKYNSLYILPFITKISETAHSKEECKELYYSIKKYGATYTFSIIDKKYYNPKKIREEDIISLELFDDIETTVPYLLNRTRNSYNSDIYFKKLIKPNLVNFFDVCTQIPYVVVAYYPKLICGKDTNETKVQKNIIKFIYQSNRDFYNFFCFYLMYRTSINICGMPYYIFINGYTNNQLDIIVQDGLIGIILSTNMTDELEKNLFRYWDKLNIYSTNILVELRKIVFINKDERELSDLCWIKYPN